MFVKKKLIKNRILPIFIVLLGGLLAGPAAAAKPAEAYAERADVRQFINEMARKHKFDKAKLAELFGQIKARPDIIERMNKPAEGLPWHKYRRIFLKPRRINEGVRFWQDNREALERAEQTYGVPPQIIVAIIGVESLYNRFKGKFPVFESLATLAFDYPRRSKFFRKELEQYLLLAREEAVDPLSLMGSYAGAMGGPQFISSSFRRYAVDFDGDGKRDLWDNTTDMIGSVANYFHVHGWKTGEAIASPAAIQGKRYKSLVKLGLRPKHTVARISGYGVKPQDELPDNAKASLIELETSDGHEYWLGLNNFYVITRYNHSALYAMAVYQLSGEIEQRHKKKKAAAARGKL